MLDMTFLSFIFCLGFYLQSDASDICKNIQFLLGAFETATGEQVYPKFVISQTIHIMLRD